MKYRFLKISILSLLVLFSCTKKEEETSKKNDYIKYIESFSPEIISSIAPIRLVLKEKVTVNTISQKIVSIQPKVEGKVTLIDGKILSFTPTDKFAADTQYSITVHLSEIIKEIPSHLKKITFQIKTMKQQFAISTFHQQAYDKDWQYIEGEVRSSDVISKEEVTQILKANQGDKKLAITFNLAGRYGTIIPFKIDSIQRFKAGSSVNLHWNGTAIHSKTKGEKTIDIIGKDNFTIIDVSVIKGTKQQIEIAFSDVLMKNQNLKGMISFKNDTNRSKYTYSIQKNILTIYPSVYKKGTQEILVYSGIKNEEGFKLKEDVTQFVSFEQEKPKVTFLQSGTILPDSENLKINFQAVSLKAVDVTVYKIYKDNVLQFLQNNTLNGGNNIRYVSRPIKKHTVNLQNQGLNLSKINAFAVDIAKLITSEAGAMYRVELSIKKEYAFYECETENDVAQIVFGEKEVSTKGYNNTKYYYDYYSDYNWNDRNNPCTNSYYRNKKISTNLLATNLGVILKKGINNQTFVAVTDLLTALPVANAKVRIYNLQQQEISSITTNTDGIATFKITEDAFFVIITKENSSTYLKLADASSLSMSKFDVSGVKLQKGVKGYIYGERGVWRPGDHLFLTFVLNDKGNPIPENHPIKFELINPQGKIIERKVVSKNKENVYLFVTKTSADALTGNWNTRVSVGGAVFQKSVKIETIKPNRLKIKINFDDEVLTATKKSKATIDVLWLHGAIAKNLKVDIQGKFRQTTTTFKNFTNYNFDNPTRRFNTKEYSIFRGKLSNEGTVDFTVRPSFKNKSPGMLKASFITKVYENGGDFSTDVFSKKVSPYKRYVGLQVPQEKQSKNYLHTNQSYPFDVATVDDKGNPIAVKNLEVKIYKLSWRWWWSTSSQNLSNYDGSTYHEPYKALKINTKSNGKGHFSLKVNERDWGRFLVVVSDKRHHHSTANVVYFDWPAWSNKSKNNDASTASMLVFSTDKDSYNVGDKATVIFQSTAASRALITIENGSEVLDSFWVETEKGQTKFEFPVLDNYTPNIFVSISLLQQHHTTKNNLPIRMYGTTAVLIKNPATILEPILKMEKEIRPEESTELLVSEKNGKSMTYTIAIVDEGLLDLTRFKTPNPWNVFYAKQSLGVKTWDIFDDVVGAYGGKIHQILSIGGDEAEAGSKNKKANRFVPMVKYLGPFTLKKGERKKHLVTIPKYIGSVRAMLVANNTVSDAYGSTAVTVPVRKPVMILASLPRKITPKEKVTLPVTVFAMKKNIKKVTVSLQPNEAFTIVGEHTKMVHFDSPDEKMLYFDLEINDFKGTGKININAEGHGEKASYAVEIDVVNPNPITTKVTPVLLQEKATKTINFSTFGVKGTNEVSLEFSTLPPMNFTKRLSYLIQYPHGCVEQTTSSVFPQLFLMDIFELSAEKKVSIERNIKTAINRLSNFQMNNGALSYWQGGNYASDWGTSYAGHFLLEASKRGYVLPIGLKTNWIEYQRSATKKWRYNSGKHYKNDLRQAYRLYTLCIANKPDLASMNRLRETNGISNQSKLRLAAGYALIGKKSVAESIIGTLAPTSNRQNYYYEGYGSENRNNAMALETFMLIDKKEKSFKLAVEIAENLSSNQWMSTQTTAYCLLAISKYAKQAGEHAGINASYIINGKTIKINSNKTMAVREFSNVTDNNTLTITNKNNGQMYVRLYNKGVLPIGEEMAVQRNLETKVVYRTKNGNVFNPLEISQGTNFIAEITLKNTAYKTIDNVALTYYIPSGWEIINTRFTDYGPSNTADVDFTDIKDDRVHYYLTLKRNQTKTFKIQLNASYLGNYYLPGTQCEAMYDNDYFVRMIGKWVRIVK